MKHQRRHLFVSLWLGLWILTPCILLGHSGFHENMTYLNELIEKAPADADLYFRRGENYRNHMKWDLAEADYEKALSLSNGFHRVSYARAKMAFMRGKFDVADGHLETFLEADPEQWEGRLLRAQSHVAQERFSSGIEDFRAAIAKSPRPVPGHYLELARARASMGRVDEALKGLAEARRVIGPVPTLYLEGLEIAKAAGKYEEALNLLSELEKRYGANPAWLVERGKLQILAKNLEEAELAFQAAVAKIQTLPARRRNVLAQKMLLQEAQTYLKDIKSP